MSQNSEIYTIQIQNAENCHLSLLYILKNNETYEAKMIFAHGGRAKVHRHYIHGYGLFLIAANLTRITVPNLAMIFKTFRYENYFFSTNHVVIAVGFDKV